MSPSDEECIERCLDGQPEAYRWLLERYQSPLLSYLTGRLGSRERAEEAAQESFVRAYFSLRTLKKPHSFFPWLFGIASRVVKEEQRAERRRKDLSAAVAERSAKQEASGDHDLEQALSKLPQAYREVVLLRYYSGLSCVQVAEQLNVPVGTVTKRLSRAYGRLRVLLGESRLRQRHSEVKR